MSSDKPITTPSAASTAETSKLSYSASVLPNGDIEEVQNIFGEVTTRFIRLSAQARDSAVRAGLKSLGWIPPEDVKELAALKESAQRQDSAHEMWISFREGVVWNVGPTRKDVETGAEIVCRYREIERRAAEIAKETSK